MDKSEKIGFHKGALECLVKERSELARLLTIVNSLIEMHIKALKEEGVELPKITAAAKEAALEEDEDAFTDIDAVLNESKKNTSS